MFFFSFVVWNLRTEPTSCWINHSSTRIRTVGFGHARQTKLMCWSWQTKKTMTSKGRLEDFSWRRAYGISHGGLSWFPIFSLGFLAFSQSFTVGGVLTTPTHAWRSGLFDIWHQVLHQLGILLNFCFFRDSAEKSRLKTQGGPWKPKNKKNKQTYIHLVQMTQKYLVGILM